MRSLFFGVLTAVCAATATMAADMPLGAPPEAAPPLYRDFNWTGIYIGMNAAYGFANPTVTATSLGASATASEKLNGALAGGQLGANWQSGSIVWGLEADIDWSGQHATTTWFGTPVIDRLLWLSTGRARVGYAADRVLIYASGGGAFGINTSSATIAGVRATDSRLRGGWTAGGGIEAAIWGGWTARAEYLFVQFLAKQRVIGPIGITDQFSDSIARIAVNYKFGGNGIASRF